MNSGSPLLGSVETIKAALSGATFGLPVSEVSYFHHIPKFHVYVQIPFYDASYICCICDTSYRYGCLWFLPICVPALTPFYQTTGKSSGNSSLDVQLIWLITMDDAILKTL